MVNKNINKLKHHLLQIPGWHTNRKIVVFESDDWGSVRMPSKEVYNRLLQSGIRVDSDLFSKYDSLENEDDLNALCNLLIKFKDINGRHPVITTNTVMANPDFKKIKESGFQEYFFEPFTKTYEKYPNHTKSFEIIRAAINEGLFKPQFHGREHLNVLLWMNALRNNHKELRMAFDNDTFGIPLSNKICNRRNLMAAYDYINEEHLNQLKKTVEEGLSLFETILGFKSQTTIAPNYIWAKELEQSFKKNGVNGFQGNYFQFSPNSNTASLKKFFHFIGQKNNIGQYYLVRNAFFEPTHFQMMNFSDEIIRRMKTNFFWGKPTIISSHRINFIGEMDIKNRDESLIKLEELIKKIMKTWPDIEFMSSNELLSLIEKND